LFGCLSGSKIFDVPLYVEPVMHVVIFVPPECNMAGLDAVAQCRGRSVVSEYRDGVQKITARIPQVEVADLSTKLWRMTDGRARTSMVLYEYWPALQPPPGDPREPAAGVREPRPKVPVGRSGAIAVPEPEDDL
jgi:translation elongation factor EF-G